MSSNKNSYFFTSLTLLLLLCGYLVLFGDTLQQHLYTLDKSNVQLYLATYSFILLSLLIIFPELLYRTALRFQWQWVVGFYERLWLFYLSLITFFAIIDSKVHAILGNHIYDPVILQSLSNPEFNKEIHFGFTTWLSIVAFLAITLLLPRVVFKLINSRAIPNLISKIALPAICVLVVGGIVFLAFRRDDLLQTEHAFPFLEESGVLGGTYIPIDRSSLPEATSYHQSYLNASENPRLQFTRKKDILILMAESFRADMINKELTPFLASLADTFSTVKSAYHYSGSHVTEKGLFSIFYGAPTFNYANFQKANIKSKFLNTLKSNGYRLLAVTASPVAHWNGSEFMMSQFDEYTEFSTKDPDVNDSLVVNHIRKMQQSPDSNTSAPRFIFVFLNSSHHNYYFPPSFEIDKPVIEKDYNHFKGDQWLRLQREKIFNRYKNSVRYIDFNVKKIVGMFKNEIENNNLIFLFTGDHGEEFWDRGFLGHAGSYLYNCRTQVPLVFHLPDNRTTSFEYTSHEELMSTIVHYLYQKPFELNHPFAASRYLDSSNVSSPQVLITSASFDKDHKLCLINSNGKYWLKINKPGTGVMVRRKFNMNDEDQSDVQLDTLLKRQIVDLMRSAPVNLGE